MKKFIILIFAINLLFASCSTDFLEVKPQDKYSDADVWSNEDLVEAFVNNIYIDLYYGFQTVMLSSLCDESMEVWGWESAPILNSQITDSYLGILNQGHWTGAFNNLGWDRTYQTIRECNYYLDKIQDSELSGNAIDQLTGEVYFLRAYLYHWLLSFYGGVPIVDKAYDPTTDDLTIARNTLAETVDFIVADCNTAANLLPLDGDKARATKGAALTLKSKVLLYAASDLYNSEGSWTDGYEHPELISYIDGDRTERWQKAKDAAYAVMQLGIYDLYGGTSAKSAEQASDDYINIFLNHGNIEDIFLRYYDNINDNNWTSPSPGLFNGPNGYHNWGGNTPTGQLVDSYEMADGTAFDWNNPLHKANPYANRDPRFYASILYNGAQWRERPDDTRGIDPEGIVQTGYYENEDGSYSPGLDTRQGPIEDWNGTYTGYYLRKFIDPAINHQYERQKLPWREMRYAEVILNYAEACLGLDQETEARTYINMIRARSGMPAIPESETGNKLIQRYRNERKIELAYENHRYFDIRRWMIATEVIKNAEGVDIRYPYGTNTPNYSIIEVQDRNWNNNKSFFLPILLDELNRNDLLIQNPGY
ncbi:RagB/SusD family nutrient uptake outer membrane protein [Plebeiibacterium marinum]|uniref:RagB/SusD family nutrient uptake outer membrane protein n=1 Tax=Plebeiibacterium marinum TaxID=2992111 RepID=A0AAE3SJ88_9BACT|nr:RagB/SusD family nutrient uptake outer membrane protein [Plebeiobacterium marinum]MCW3805505.1 RagB/SusD family nutrient uptake outer membrane protein [Plebeiobacterium marinum]